GRLTSNPTDLPLSCRGHELLCPVKFAVVPCQGPFSPSPLSQPQRRTQHATTHVHPRGTSGTPRPRRPLGPNRRPTRLRRRGARTRRRPRGHGANRPPRRRRTHRGHPANPPRTTGERPGRATALSRLRAPLYRPP